MRIDQYDHPYLFFCGIGDTEEKALFDLSSLNILSRGIKSVHQFNRYDKNFLRLNKLNGKCNAFDVNKQVELVFQHLLMIQIRYIVQVKTITYILYQIMGWISISFIVGRIKIVMAIMGQILTHSTHLKRFLICIT